MILNRTNVERKVSSALRIFMQETKTLQEKNQKKNEEKEGGRAGHAPLRGAERKCTLKEPGIKYISILLIQTQIVKSSCDPLHHMNSRVLGGVGQRRAKKRKGSLATDHLLPWVS